MTTPNIEELIDRLRDPQTRGTTGEWFDRAVAADLLQSQAERIATLEDAVEYLLDIEEMDEVAITYAHRIAMVLECEWMDRAGGRWWKEGIDPIGEYRSAMNAIHEQHSPTFMGEPLL